jgi:hypothetical protein
VIPLDSKIKQSFDLLMSFVCVSNVFINVYYANYGLNHDSQTLVNLDLASEFLFLLDMIFNFFLEYKDEETFERISSFLVISKKYATSTFILDFIAWIPIEYMIGIYQGKFYKFRLLKLFRIPRLKKLLNVEKFKANLSIYYNKQLQRAVQKEDYNYNYPIEFVITTIYKYKIASLLIIIVTIAYLLHMFWIIVARDILNCEEYDLCFYNYY